MKSTGRLSFPMDSNPSTRPLIKEIIFDSPDDCLLFFTNQIMIPMSNARTNAEITMNSNECNDALSLSLTGVIIESIKKFPSLSYSINAVMMRQRSKQITSQPLYDDRSNQAVEWNFFRFIQGATTCHFSQAGNGKIGEVTYHERIECA